MTRVDADEGEKGHLFSQGLILQVPTALEGHNRDLGLGWKEASPPALSNTSVKCQGKLATFLSIDLSLRVFFKVVFVCKVCL